MNGMNYDIDNSMENDMRFANTKVSEGGRVVIPAEFRKALGMKIGDDVILALADGELKVFTRSEAIRRGAGDGGQLRPRGPLIGRRAHC